MEFTRRQTNGTVEVVMTGRLDFTDHERLRDAVAVLETPDIGALVVNLQKLEFIDSAGMGMLLILGEEAEQRNIAYRLTQPQGAVRRALELAKLGEVLTIDY